MGCVASSHCRWDEAKIPIFDWLLNDRFYTIVRSFTVDQISTILLLSSLMREAVSHKVVKKGKINRKNMLGIMKSINQHQQNYILNNIIEVLMSWFFISSLPFSKRFGYKKKIESIVINNQFLSIIVTVNLWYYGNFGNITSQF
jgi:hypothetical protein